MEQIVIYTDGSCHTQKRVGAWAAFIYVNGVQTVLSGMAFDTSHHRMELMAVNEALVFVLKNYPQQFYFEIVTDSQYVIGLIDRAAALIAKNFISKKGNPTRNVDLVQLFFALKDKAQPTFTKIKSHLPETADFNGNNEVDAFVKTLMNKAAEESF